MSWIIDEYRVKYQDNQIGMYYVYDDGTWYYSFSDNVTDDGRKKIADLGLDRSREGKRVLKVFRELIKDENRVPGRRRIIYRKGDLLLEREPKQVERYYVYRLSAKKGDPDYSPLKHDAPHYEGKHTPEGMREWCSWYAFNKMDDGTYQASLDEAWWWGGGHNDGGTITREIPEDWLDLPYEEFLENAVTLAAALHYGFTAEQLREKPGLREFLGYSQENDD